MIKGITVTLITRTQNGTTRWARLFTKESTASVDNVLVAPTSSDDVVIKQSSTGRKAVYTLAIPKGDTTLGKTRSLSSLASGGECSASRHKGLMT